MQSCDALIYLKALDLDDIEHLLAHGSLPPDELPAFEGSLPPPHVLLRSQQALRSGCASVWATPFHIVDGAQQRVVGGCGFKGAPQDGEVEIGYAVAPSQQRRGFARAGISLLLRLAAEQRSDIKVVALIALDNTASRCLAEQLGFAYAGQRID